mgnify:CR=1 FL=1|tara:strand:- start:2177 stop:2422 length:246 start_codon:yes stop_codon:yes gene_type:complete
MTRIAITIFIVIFSLQTGIANEDWGKTGHRVTGEIAEKYLSRKSKKAIDALLNGHSLAFVSNYADDIKTMTLIENMARGTM